MPDLSAVLSDLHAESESLDALVAPLSEADWDRQTPAEGWTIAYQIAHLAWTDDTSIKAVTDPEAFAEVVEWATRMPDTFVDSATETLASSQAPSLLLQSWRTLRAELAEALAGVPDGTKLPWFGPPMSATSMATARLMETWAHGQDVADALGVVRPPTDRLRHVAHIGVRTRDFAYAVHGEPAPDAPFRVELAAPSGEQWAWGPDDAVQRVSGPAHDFCLLVVQRRHRDDLALVAEGPDADHWLDIAQAFAGPPGTGRQKGQFA